MPWSDTFEFDEPTFRRTVRGLVDAGFRDLYVFGTAGEGYAVNDRQFIEVVEAFRDETRQLEVEPMVGVISLSLSTTLSRIAGCVDRGIRRFQVSLPSWGALSETETRAFFDQVCGRYPQAEFLHYNLSRAGRLITAQEYAVLSRRHSNLVATKNATASAEVLRELTKSSERLRHFVDEPGWSFGVEGLGFLVSTASINPRLAHKYHQAGINRDSASLARYSGELHALTQALLHCAGPEVHIDGAFDKVFHRLHHPEFNLRLLPPYSSVSDAAFQQFRDLVYDRFPDWAAGFSSSSNATQGLD